jgi:hypothetical protein
MIARWWIYQRERFPLGAHGPIVAVFSWAALSYSVMLRGQGPAPGPYLAAFASALLCFLLLRIADEFKDYTDDARYRPYRPVPRGLVTLRGLAVVGALAAAVQLGAALWVGVALLPLLLLVWSWMALMSCEFFAGRWLRARPVAYLLSHLLVVPLIALYVSAFDWRVADVPPSEGLGWLLGASFFGGMVFELGRKIRAPGDEEQGVETYSALWGVQKAAAWWLGAVTLGSAQTLIALWVGGGPLGLSLLPITALAAAFVAALRYTRIPVRASARLVEQASVLSTLACYLAIGLLPLLTGGNP